jgi:hypothetical protein
MQDSLFKILLQTTQQNGLAKPDHSAARACIGHKSLRICDQCRLVSLSFAFVLIACFVERVGSQTVDPVQELAALQNKILSKGPGGEEPSPASSVSLSA